MVIKCALGLAWVVVLTGCAGWGPFGEHGYRDTRGEVQYTPKQNYYGLELFQIYRFNAERPK